MLLHEDLWRAVDHLAQRYGLSPSGLARRAGLDPTTFNKSKRVTREGKERWPSCETIARILNATGASLAEFLSLIDAEAAQQPRQVPSITLAEAESDRAFDSKGRPQGAGWRKIEVPGLTDPEAYAIKVGGDALQPVNRDGDLLLVAPTAAVNDGDRIVARTVTGRLFVGRLTSRGGGQVEITLPQQRPLRLENREIAWLARVLWTSQ